MSKINKRNKIKKRIRGKIKGTALRPRLSVFRSANEIYAQLINDEQSITICASSSLSKTINDKGTRTAIATLVGAQLAEKAKIAGVEKVVFDRGGFLYHGRVKALADAARDGGLVF